MEIQNGEVVTSKGIYPSRFGISILFPIGGALFLVLGILSIFISKLLIIPMGIIGAALLFYPFYLLIYVLPDLAEKDRIMLEELKQKKERGEET